MKQQFFDRRQVARILGVSETTVKEMVRQGVLPAAKKLLGSARWHRSHVLAVVERLKSEDISRAPLGAVGRPRVSRKNTQKDG